MLSDGMHLVTDIVQIVRTDVTTEVLISSMCYPIHLLGAHMSTVPFSVIQNLVGHPPTDIDLKRFFADWEKVPEKPF